MPTTADLPDETWRRSPDRPGWTQGGSSSEPFLPNPPRHPLFEPHAEEDQDTREEQYPDERGYYSEEEEEIKAQMKAYEESCPHTGEGGQLPPNQN